MNKQLKTKDRTGDGEKASSMERKDVPKALKH
jgi:hypothetical protein